MSGGEVDLSWGASTDDVGVTGYKVERCQGAGCTNFAQIATPAGTTYKDTSVSASTSYSYRVRATDAAGNLSPYSNTASATTPTPDTTPPSQPGTLSATAVSGGEVDLSWGASTDDVGVTGYKVERCQGAGCTNFAQIATPAGTSYKDTSVSASTSYSYRVRATDAAGQPEHLLEHRNRPDARHDPAVAAGDVVRDGRLGQRGRSVVGRLHRQRRRHRLQGRALPGRGLHELRPDRDARRHHATRTPTSAHRPSYSYRVRATDAAGNLSTYSNTANATTPTPDTTPPTQPGTLTATAVSGSEVDLSWGASTDNVGVTGYKVERCQGTGCTNFAQIATPGRHELQGHQRQRLDEL